MNTHKSKLIAAVSGLLLASVPVAHAVQITATTALNTSTLTLGKDITVNDANNGSAATYGGAANADTRVALPYGLSSGSTISVREDQEVESPNAVWDQSWDLEAVFFNSAISKLSIVGGFDFATGNNNQYRSGDLNIDITPFSSTLNAYQPSINYVVKFNWDDTFGNTPGNSWTSVAAAGQNAINVSYSIYKIDGINDGTFSNSVYFGTSDPWRYNPGANEVALDTGVATVVKFSTFNGGGLTTDQGYTLQGSGSRYALMIGGSVLADPAPSGIAAILADANVTEFGGNFTMRCGNDEITGWNPNSNQVFVPDSGTTLILLGMSLLGLGLLRRKE